MRVAGQIQRCANPRGPGAAGAALAFALASVLTACGDDSVRTPVQPSPVPIPVPAPVPSPTLVIDGPKVLTRGQTAKYTAITRLPDGTTQDRTDAAEWTSSNLTVASVNPGGLVTGRQEGGVDIGAAYQGLSSSLTIRVAAPELRLSGRAELTRRGETSQLALAATHADGSREDVTSAARWASSDPNVATVNVTGLVTAVDNGRTEIEATYEGVSARLAIMVSLPVPRLIIDAPTSNPTSLTVTFEWHLQDADPIRTYQFQVRIDKGVNACDQGIEEAFSAGTATRLTVTFDGRRYSGQSVDFGIQAEDGRGFKTCEQGRRFTLP